MPCDSRWRSPVDVVSATVRRTLALLAVVVCAGAVALLILQPWSEPEDPGDPQAFCGFLGEGIGLGGGEIPSTDYDVLGAVAPPEIRTVVNQLRNSARSISEIANDDPVNLAELFSARFDPDAVASQSQLEEYALTTCNIDLEQGVPIPLEELEVQVRDYLDANHSSAPWVNAIEVRPVVENGQLDSMLVRFLRPPEDADQPREVCEALAVYLYAIRGAPGFVSVESNGTIVARRASPADACTTS